MRTALSFATYRAAFACAGVVFAFAAQAQDAMELKGYVLGAPMADCPAETVARTPRPPELMCQLGPTTLANQPVKAVVVSIYQGRIASVFFSLEERGRNAHGTLRDALQEKFGPPSDSKPHVNEYTWRRGQQGMRLDGWTGGVLLIDREAQTRMDRERRDSGKKDL